MIVIAQDATIHDCARLPWSLGYHGRQPGVLVLVRNIETGGGNIAKVFEGTSQQATAVMCAVADQITSLGGDMEVINLRKIGQEV